MDYGDSSCGIVSDEDGHTTFTNLCAARELLSKEKKRVGDKHTFVLYKYTKQEWVERWEEVK
jgi:hypothetical protein